jgi:hypothetical protein
MKNFKLLLLLILSVSIISALTGIKFIRISQSGFETVLFEGIERIYPILCAIILCVFYYGISKRKYIVYRAGWGMFILGFVYSISSLTIGIIEKGSTWISFSFGILASVLFLIYVGKWWRNNRDYFHKSK